MQRSYVLNANQASTSTTPHSSEQKTTTNDQTKTQQQRLVNEPIRLTSSLVSQGQSTIRQPIKLQLMMHNQKDKGAVRQPIKISQLAQELKSGATQTPRVQNSSQKIQVNSNDQNKPQTVTSGYNLYQRSNLYQSAATNIQQQTKKQQTVQKTTSGNPIPRVVRTDSGKNQALGQQIKGNIIPSTSYQQNQQQLQQQYQQQQAQNKQNTTTEQKSSFSTLYKNKQQTPQNQTQTQTQITQAQTPNKVQEYPSSLYSGSKTSSQNKYVASTQVTNKQPTQSQQNSQRTSLSTDQKYQGYNQYQQYQQQLLEKLKQQKQQKQQPKKQEQQPIQQQQQQSQQLQHSPQQQSGQKSNINYSPGVVKQAQQSPSPKTKLELGKSLSLNQSQPLESARSNFYNQDQSNLFSQFKVKYDELRMNYDKLRQEYDDTNREKKKMEIKLLNSNPEYYEKEIKRLRTEVQKFQQQNQDHKYKYLQAQNVKKQLQATNKVKQEELKTLIKQLQKQKINNVQLKHQNDQRQRVFNRIRMEFEKSNEGTLKNYDEAITKANKLDGAFKTKSAEYDQLKNNFQRLERRHNENKQEFKKYKEINEERVKNMTKNLETKTTESHKAKVEATNRISELQQQIQKLKSERASIQLLKTRKTQQVSVIKSNRQLELDIVRLEDRIRNLEYDLLQKDSIIIELQKTIDKIKLNQQVKECEQKIRILQQEKSEILRQNQKVKGQMIREIDRLKLQLMQAPEQVYHSSNTNFQDILKIQLDENAKLKRELSIKIDQIYNLKSDIDEIKVDKQNLLSEIDILKKIKKSQEKNVKIQSEIAAQHVKNDIDSYKRKIQLLQQKLVLKNKEVKQKDNFIMSSVLGRSKPEDAPFIMADFQRIFQTNYVQKLAEANKRIENLNNPQQTPLTARNTQGTPYKR